jgi:hypothetical protein
MSDSLIDKARGFLVRPVETFQASRGDTFESAFTYYIILLVIYAVLTALVSLIGIAVVPWLATGAQGGVVAFFTSMISTIIGGIIGLFVIGLILHVFVLLVGGGKGAGQTLKAYMYGSTPNLLIGWIPIIGILGAIYMIVLWVIGIRELHQISTTRAILAVVIPVLIAIVIIALLLAAFIVAFAQTYPGTF